MKKTKKLILATYNIQFSLYPEEIKTNIAKMAQEGISIFCLQEVTHSPGKTFIIDILLKELGSDWDAISNLGEEQSVLGMGNCIIWNTKVLDLKKIQNEFLPKSKALSMHEKVFSWIVGGISVPFQRRAIIGYFEFNNRLIRVSNIHLDHNGGLENRKKQLSYFVDILKKDKTINNEIICGDFNSFDLLKNGKESLMHTEIIGNHFVDVSKNSGWTADLNAIDIKHGGIFFKFIIKYFHLHIKRKLDYIWTKNIISSHCEKLFLNGSDHNPLIAYLNV